MHRGRRLGLFVQARGRRTTPHHAAAMVASVKDSAMKANPTLAPAVVEDPSIKAGAPHTNGHVPAPTRVNILLVDDRNDKLLAVEAALSSLGQNIVKARSGKEALRHLLNQDFAVILLDVAMPGMDGFETATMIRKRPRTEHTPIIFITSISNSETNIFQGYKLGAVDYIITPILPDRKST